MEPTYCDPEEVSLSSQMLNHRYRHKYVNQRDSTLQRGSEMLKYPVYAGHGNIHSKKTVFKVSL